MNSTLHTSQDALNLNDTSTALRFITCGSVDDGKSTLIGRLLFDSRAVLRDQLASVERAGQPDLALLTDGLQAEREQGITIDVAHRYFNTARRKFIIADTPGHEQYTRNMVTAASSADAAVVLVDATKLAWQEQVPSLLEQTRRHCLLLAMLRVPSVVFAINKLDAVADPQLAYAHIGTALRQFAQQAALSIDACVPISALEGYNVVQSRKHWCGYDGPSLLDLLQALPVAHQKTDMPLVLPVQWVEKFSSSSDTNQGRRLFWGRVATGQLRAGQSITVHPSGKRAKVVQVLDSARRPAAVGAGRSAGVILDRELDISRGDTLQSSGASEAAVTSTLRARVAWLDDEPLLPGRSYWALHGHRWVKAKVTRIINQTQISTLETHPATQLGPNAIGLIDLALQEPLPALSYRQSQAMGSLILVDTASHRTSGALMVESP